MKYIKTILKEALYVQNYVGEVPLTIPKKDGFGDYTSQILLQNKLDSKALIIELLKSKIIKSVEVINGHLNIYIDDELIYVEETNVFVSGFNRMKVIRDRLYDEGYTSGIIPAFFYPLSKKVNELLLSINELNDSDGLEKELIKRFKILDLGYIYRNLSKSELGGIYKLLNTCLMALERVNNE